MADGFDWGGAEAAFVVKGNDDGVVWEGRGVIGAERGLVDSSSSRAHVFALSARKQATSRCREASMGFLPASVLWSLASLARCQNVLVCASEEEGKKDGRTTLK